MTWTVELKPSVVADLKWLGKKQSKAVFSRAVALLEKNPLADSKNMKTLRPNAAAERELRVLGDYRVLFNVDQASQTVTLMVVGEKQGNKLVVQGKEFTRHHESHTPEQSEGAT